MNHTAFTSSSFLDPKNFQLQTPFLDPLSSFYSTWFKGNLSVNQILGSDLARSHPSGRHYYQDQRKHHKGNCKDWI